MPSIADVEVNLGRCDPGHVDGELLAGDAAVEPSEQAERSHESDQRNDQRHRCGWLCGAMRGISQRDQEAGQRQQREPRSAGSSQASQRSAGDGQPRSPAPSRTAPRWRNCGYCRIAAAAARCPCSRARAHAVHRAIDHAGVHALPQHRARAADQRLHHRGVVDLIHEVLVVDQACRGRLKLDARESAMPGLATYINVGEQDADQPGGHRDGHQRRSLRALRAPGNSLLEERRES